MLKYLLVNSIIFIINVNCGLIKSELPNNETFKHLELTNTIENITIPNTTSFKPSVDNLTFTELSTTASPAHHESNTFYENITLFPTKELPTTIIPITENEKKTSISEVDNIYQFSTTTEQSHLKESSTIYNDDVVSKNKNLYEKKNGNILIDTDYTTETINKDVQNLYSTPETTTFNDSLVDTTIQTTTDNNEAAITLNNKNKILLENSKSNSVNIVNTSIYSKLNEHNRVNFSSYSTELVHSPTTTTKSLEHQSKLNKNYDIVTNEIGNITIPNTSGNVKLAKFFKENSTNSKDLSVIDSGENLHFSGIKKNIKDIEKLKQNIVNNTEKIFNPPNITKSAISSRFPDNLLAISKDSLPLTTTSNPTYFSTEIIIPYTKTIENNISIYGVVNNVEQMKMTETKNLNINMNTVSSSYVELSTTDISAISTTEMTTTAANTNENFKSVQTTENYQNTNIYVIKNGFTEQNYGTEFTENLSTTTANLINIHTTSTDVMMTTELNTNNVKTTENLNTSFLNKNNLDMLTSTTVADISTSTPILVDDNFTTTNNNEFKITTPINEDLFSAPVTEPETAIETNSIERTEKSTMGTYSNTSPFLNILTITTGASPKYADIKQDDTNDTTISLFTTVSSKIAVVPTESTINKVNDTVISNILINEQSLNKSQSSEIEGMERSSNDPDYNVVIAISVSVTGIVALILLVGFLYVMRKRQKQLTYGQRCRPVSLDAYSLDNVSIYNSVRRKAALRASKRSYGNAAFDDPALIHNNISIADLAKFVERKSAIYEEFKGIPQIIARTDEVPQGCEEKNRYANVVPLPETRVILQQIDNDEKTEYINANFVRGPKDSPNYYIACQAPLEGTVVDFWRMIWEQNSRVIIMATDLIENGIEKCAEYLPASITLDNHIIFGDFQITLKNREVKERYAVSILFLKNMKMNQSREITHFWYQWPETGVPIDQAGVIAMLLEARSCLKVSYTDQTDKETTKMTTEKVANGESNGSLENNKGLLKTQGPLVVHCSPGTGRTGTITTIDIALRSLETTKRVDIPQIVYYVRRGRASSVQTTEQYEFIYRVVNVYATKITGSANDN